MKIKISQSQEAEKQVEMPTSFGSDSGRILNMGDESYKMRKGVWEFETWVFSHIRVDGSEYHRREFLERQMGKVLQYEPIKRDLKTS